MAERRQATGDGGLEAFRILKRRLSDVIYQALRTDLHLIAEHRIARQKGKGTVPPVAPPWTTMRRRPGGTSMPQGERW